MAGLMRHKILSTILFSMVFTLSVNCQTNQNKAKSCKFLTSTDAEKILGASVELVESKQSDSTTEKRFGCTYRRLEKDKLTGREVNLFLTIIESPTNEKAKQLYDEIWNSNKNHQGVEVLNGIGDEAYSHSDKPNFHFVMVRKGSFTIRMKVNKAVETTSFDELKAIAKRVVAEI